MPNRRRKIDFTKVRIRVTVKRNPRRSTTKAGKRFASMVPFVRRHPKATARQVFKSTAYRSDDANWDAKHDYIKLVAAR